jgi:hypothetical protein
MTDTIQPLYYDSLAFTSPYTDTLFARKDSLWGLINVKQDTVVAFRYQNIKKQLYNFTVKDSVSNKRIKQSLTTAYKKDAGWGIVLGKDSIIVPFIFDTLDIAILPHEIRPSDTITQQKIFMKVKNEQNLWGIMNMNSDWLLDCQYANIESDEKNGFRLFNDENKVGFFNPRTGLTITPLYKSIKFITKGVFEILSFKDKKGFIDDFGNEYFFDEPDKMKN